MTLTTELPIEGMTCAACAARIGRGLSGLDGVVEANVNYATARAVVSYDPDAVEPAAFSTTIQKLGYAVATDGDASEEQLAELGHRLVAAIVLSVPTVAISMVPTLRSSTSIVVPSSSRAVLAPRPASALMASPDRRLARASNHRPRRISVTMTAAVSK